MVKLYDALKSSYGDRKARDQLKKAGYNYDSMLSNHNQQVWYNPNDKKMMVNIAGTHNLKDWGTDVALAFGKLKSTGRYKQAEKVLKQAKSKYGNDIQTNITGHSLGGSIAQKIGSKKDNDKVIALDSGYTIGQKTRSYDGNQQHFRTKGDVVSLLGSNAKNMKTLKNNNIKTGILPYDVLKSHDIENIKNENIFI